MLNTKKMMSLIFSLICLFIALSTNAIKNHQITVNEIEQLGSPNYTLKPVSTKISARFNFEHARFQFVVTDEQNVFPKQIKRKRLAFSNLA